VTKLIHSNKEYKTMKKLALVLALAVVLTFALTAVAFADHSPSFYIQWNDNGGYSEANSSTPSPHAGYAEGTQKCAVCHAVHRAAVAGIGYATDAQRAAIGGDPAQGGIETQNPPDGSFPADAGGTNRAKRATYLVPDGENTQMLLQSDVAGACDYCHIETSVGGEQIYAGAVKYRLEADSASGGSDWEGGFAHNNACTACHAVHGAFTLASSTPAGNIVFKGAAAPKVLKAYAKNASTTWQSAVVTAGFGMTDAALAPYFAAPAAVVRDAAANATVDTGNVPLLASKADALAGTNHRIGVDEADAQVTAFCSFCHENYGWASEQTINPQNVGATPATVAAQRALAFDAKVVGKGLFQGPWIYKSGGTIYAVRDSSTATAFAPGLDGQVPVKNHPMKNAEVSFVAAGDNFAGQAAFKDSNTCRDCHDAGVEEYVGVMVQSFPHFTPGYFKFLKAADKLGGTMANIDPDIALTPTVAAGDAAGLAAIQGVLDDPLVIEEAQCTADGACLKCHVNAAGTAGVGVTF
jgi:hypothetical protein